jgi:hypothetical protein
VQPPALPQSEQDDPPASDEDDPDASFDTAAKTDMMRLAGALQTGQELSSVARLKGRSSSNLLLHLAHLYSYNGIFLPRIKRCNFHKYMETVCCIIPDLHAPMNSVSGPQW